MSARRILDQQLSEAQWMDSVTDLLTAQGFLWAHIPDKLYALAAKEGRFDAMTGAAKLPDLIVIGLDYSQGDRPVPTLYLLETKTERGRVDPGQQEWIDRANRAVAVRGEILRPSNWPWLKYMLSGVDDELEDR